MYVYMYLCIYMYAYAYTSRARARALSHSLSLSLAFSCSRRSERGQRRSDYLTTPLCYHAVTLPQPSQTPSVRKSFDIFTSYISISPSIQAEFRHCILAGIMM